MSEIDDESLMKELADDFGVEEKPAGRSAREQRILAGFEDIERFVEQHGRAPEHGEERDIFERLYAVRLDRLRRSPECRAVLRDADTQGLLGEAAEPTSASPNEPDDAELQAELADVAVEDDLTKLVHVRPHEERKVAEEVAQRSPCPDFDIFRPIFEKVQKELDAKTRTTVPFEHDGGFKVGDLFILDGQKAYVAAVGEAMMKEFGREDRRLRVVFDNATESNMLLRSLQRALYKVEHGRRILPSGQAIAPLFTATQEDGDQESGHIYVLRSKSEHPYVAQNRLILHKIGMTGGDVRARLANAKKDATYLLADVEVVATYRLANVNGKKLEALLHRLFSSVRVDLTLKDRFGFDVAPTEWFLVPATAIDEAIERIRDESIDRFRYDPKSAQFVAV